MTESADCHHHVPLCAERKEWQLPETTADRETTSLVLRPPKQTVSHELLGMMVYDVSQDISLFHQETLEKGSLFLQHHVSRPELLEENLWQ